MDPVREYIEQVAGGDVRAALAWLDGAGFRITKSQGGRGESFGNALLVFSGISPSHRDATVTGTALPS
jgi:hypothetical protein